MQLLSLCQLTQISGGIQPSDTCYNAYHHMVNNQVSATNIFLFIFLTPLAWIGSIVGQDSLVRSICGNTNEYNRAKQQYCALIDPQHCKEPSSS